MTFAEIMQLKGKEAGLSFTAQQLEHSVLIMNCLWRRIK